MSDLKIGGRLFSVANMERRTVLMDHYQMALLRSIGLDRVMPEDKEEGQDWLMRLHAELLASGKTCELLGAYLLPSGKTERDWTPEMAQQTARHLERCDTAEDRDLVNELALEFVFGFFRHAVRSLETSRISFERAGGILRNVATAAH